MSQFRRFCEVVPKRIDTPFAVTHDGTHAKTLTNWMPAQCAATRTVALRSGRRHIWIDRHSLRAMRHDTKLRTRDLRIRGRESESRRRALEMKSKKPSMFLRHALVSSIVVLMIGFLGLGVRVFATADTTRHIFFAAFLISVVILVSYFMFRRRTRRSTTLRTQAERSVVRDEIERLPENLDLVPPLLQTGAD